MGEDVEEEIINGEVGEIDLLDEESMPSIPEPGETKLKVDRPVSILTEKYRELIEKLQCSTMDIKRAVEYWIRKQPVPDLTDKIDGIIKEYDDEVGIKRKERRGNELGTDV
jgi:hypothetical protein